MCGGRAYIVFLRGTSGLMQAPLGSPVLSCNVKSQRDLPDVAGSVHLKFQSVEVPYAVNERFIFIR